MKSTIRIILALGICFYSLNVYTQDVVIQEVLYNTASANDKIMLCNTTDGEVDMTGWQLCSRFSYADLSSLTIESGSLPLQGGECIILSGFDFDDNSADVGLYSSASFSSFAAMVDFVQYGTAVDVGRVDVAVAKGIWTEISSDVFDFVASSAVDESLQFDGTNGGSGELSLSTDFINTTPEFEPEPFITSWQVEVNDTIVILLQSGTYNFDYIWTLTTDNSVQISGTHTNADGEFETAFIDAGIYELAIIGDFSHLRNYPQSKLLDVLQWGDIVWGSMESMFSNWKGTGFSATDAPDMSQVTNMNNMFTKATNFNEDLNHWDVSNVTELTSIFEQARIFNGNITNWNVSKVTSFRRAFDNAVSFNQDISDWDMSSATTVEKMFENADAFNQPIGKWDVSNVTQFRRMLPGMANFNQSLGNWKFKQNANINFSQFATGTNSMSCENYSSTLLGWNFINPTLENVNLEGFNADYNSLASVARDEMIARGWQINNNGINIINCGATIPFIATWQVFEDDTITIPLGNFNYDFNYTWTHTTDNSIQIMGNHTNADGPFETAFITPGIYKLEILRDFPSLTGYPKAQLLDVLQWGDNVWLTMQAMFQNWSGAGFLATDTPNLIAVENMSDIFNNARNFNDDISDWDVSSVTNMIRAFRDASSYNQPLDNWDVRNVTRFDQIFTRMPSFDQPLGNWQFKQGANVREFSSGITNNVSCENWSTTIRGWLHNNPDISNLRISGFSVDYDSLASIARDTLLTRGWTIIGTDIGGDCGGIDPCDNDLRAPEIEEFDDIRAQCEVNMIPAPVAVDLCQGEIIGVTDDPLSYNEKGVYRINWVFDDGVGNIDSAVQLVIIDDTTAPEPDVPSLPQVNAPCDVTITTIPTATDNCAGTIIATTDDPLTYSEQGTFTITWTYVDNEGNTSSQEQTVVISDTVAPVPTIDALSDVNEECSATATAPTATDNCAGTITATTDDPLTYTEQGSFTITWTYDDGNGNTVTQQQTVIVDDVTAPMITLSGEGSITLDCEATSFTDPGAMASDNCDGVTVETTGTVDVSTPGNYTLTYKAVDIGDNESAEVTRTVVVPTIEECTDCVQDLILTAALLAADPHGALFSADSTITIDGVITDDEQITLSASDGIEFLGTTADQFEVESGAQLEVNLESCTDLLNSLMRSEAKR